MSVFSDLKSRFRRGAEEEFEDEEPLEEELPEDEGAPARDLRAASGDFGAFEAPEPLSTGLPALSDLPNIDLPAEGESHRSLPLISRDDVRQYLRGMDRPRPQEQPHPDAPRAFVPADMPHVAVGREVAVVPGQPLPVSGQPAAPAPVAEPQGEPRPLGVAMSGVVAHPGYGQSAFMGPRDDASSAAQPVVAPAPAPASAAPAVAPSPAAAAVPTESLPGFRQGLIPQGAADDFAPRDTAAPAPVSGGFYREAAPVQGQSAPVSAPAPYPVAPTPMAQPMVPTPDTASLYASDAVTHVPPTTVRELVVVNPGSFEDAEMISTGLRARKVVVVNVRQVPDFLSRRIMDFAFGAASATGANVGVVANKIYALTFDRPLNEYEILSLRNRGAL